MTKPPETLGERMAVAIEGAGLNQTTLAKRLGVARNTVIVWMRENDIREEQLERVAQVTGRSKSWLRYGIVDAAEVSVERYITGFEDGKAMAIEYIQHMQPPARAALEEPLGKPGVMDARPPADREVQRAGVPFTGHTAKKGKSKGA